MFGSKNETSPDLEFYTIYDSKSASYCPPIQAINRHVLIRDIVNEFKKPEGQKNHHYTNAEDFSLFKTGTFDKKTGLVTTQNLELIANIHELRTMAQHDISKGALSPT